MSAEPVKPADSPDWWDHTAAWLAVHGPLAALGVITVAIALVHIHVFWGEPAGDDLSFHFAESARMADCIAALDFDFWNPSANGGFASMYYYQAIPQLASAIPAAIFDHHLFWFQLSVWLPHVLAPAAAYRGMRLLGATPWQSAAAALAVAFMNGQSRWGTGNAGTFQVGLYTQTWALAAFPLALGHGARWIREKRGLAPAIAWGAFVGLCHPFAVIVLGLGLATSVIAALVPRLEPLRWPSVVGRLEIIVGLLVMLGLPRKWWPFDNFEWILGGLLVASGVAMPRIFRKDTKWVFPDWRQVRGELIRTAILGALMILAWMPIWLPLLTDGEGFGGFPHRVNDEVGPGFYGLTSWYMKGEILDWIPPQVGGRFAVLTVALPIVLLFARANFLRWLWPPALLYAVLLGIGPHMGKIGDDLFPPVRALGAMQIVLALGTGAGAVIIGKQLWSYRYGPKLSRVLRFSKWIRTAEQRAIERGDTSPMQYAAQTALAAIAAVVIVLFVVPGSRALNARVRVLADFPASNREELMTINEILGKQPQARKQAATGAENHWWNLLSYAYERVPSVLMMGGGGLQASPNYDFLWNSQRDYVRHAWIYNAPYVVFNRSLGSKIPNGETIARTTTFEIRRIAAPGWVSPVQVTGVLPADKTERKKKALEWLKSSDPMHDRVLAYDGFGGAGPPPAGKTIRSWEQDSPGDDADVVAELEVEQPTTFVVRESWHPRWHAYLDGTEIAVRRVTPDFPAVDVPPGKHTLELRFERPWWLLACWLVWPGTVIATWLFFRRRQRRGGEAPVPLPVASVAAAPASAPVATPASSTDAGSGIDGSPGT